MKKRTVITTEKHEVWVIKQPSAATDEERREPQKSEPGGGSLQPRPEEQPDEDVPRDRGK
jgi:hypothetical protein